jgi:hypothetical protein
MGTPTMGTIRTVKAWLRERARKRTGTRGISTLARTPLPSSPAELAETWAATVRGEAHRLLAKLDEREYRLLGVLMGNDRLRRYLSACLQSDTLAHFAHILRERQRTSNDDTVRTKP